MPGKAVIGPQRRRVCARLPVAQKTQKKIRPATLASRGFSVLNLADNNLKGARKDRLSLIPLLFVKLGGVSGHPAFTGRSDRIRVENGG